MLQQSRDISGIILIDYMVTFLAFVLVEANGLLRIHSKGVFDSHNDVRPDKVESNK